MPTRKVYTIEDMKAVAKSRGGECLSAMFVNCHDKLTWKCMHGHIWDTRFWTIKKGSWCPVCSVGIRERLFGCFLSQKLKCEFIKARLEWLRSDSGHKLELDFYNADNAIAFEHNGSQHVKKISKFHMDDGDLSAARRRDEIKQEGCIENGVCLIVIPQLIEGLKLSELSNYVKRNLVECGKTHIMRDDYDKIEVDYYTAYASNHCVQSYNELTSIANERGGALLSSCYNGAGFLLEWRCANGHIWKAAPQHIKRGSWCRRCYADSRKYTIQDAKNAAELKGGRCLSSNYIDSKNSLLFECADGHQWKARLNEIRDNRWCPFCSRNRVTIDMVVATAKKYGLKCLSDKYTNNTTKMLWRCGKGHIFERAYTSISRGHTRCARCFCER